MKQRPDGAGCGTEKCAIADDVGRNRRAIGIRLGCPGNVCFRADPRGIKFGGSWSGSPCPLSKKSRRNHAHRLSSVRADFSDLRWTHFLFACVRPFGVTACFFPAPVCVCMFSCSICLRSPPITFRVHLSFLFLAPPPLLLLCMFPT